MLLAHVEVGQGRRRSTSLKQCMQDFLTCAGVNTSVVSVVLVVVVVAVAEASSEVVVSSVAVSGFGLSAISLGSSFFLAAG